MPLHQFKKLSLWLAYYICFIYKDIFVPLALKIYYCSLSLLEQAKLVVNSDDLDNLRIPKHLVMSFTNEMDDLDLDAIARLLLWSKKLGVENITLYDKLGRLKDKQKELFKFIKFIANSGNENYQVDQLDCINILSRSDGRSKFVEDIRELVKLPPEEINLELVHRRVGWTIDPELLINFGSPLCLYGFPPWPLRLTEIFTIPTHRKIPRRVFIDCLKKFSRTSQREGV